MTNIATAYGKKVRVQTNFKGVESMTKQSFAKELDVNNIIRKYNKTGVLQKLTEFEGEYGEFDEYDLRTAIEKVQKANDMFQEVPSKIRAQFDNNAGKFIDFATNEANLDQMREWGLAKPEKLPDPKPEPQKVVIVEDQSSKTSE